MRECPRCERCYEDEVLACPEEGANTKQTLPGGTLLAGRYLIEKRLGRGAMGQVYMARDENLVTRRVAVKTIRPDILSDEGMGEEEAIARFEREARTAASIRHPNVVDVTDFGKTPTGVFFLVMEYVEGETLYHLLRREGTLSIQRTLALLRQVAAGVEAAHEEGILHRDLKPANIFIMKKRKGNSSLSGDGFIKVGDFGLAKIISGAVAEATTGGGPSSRGIIGTPEYMAPEQMQPGTKLDARADVYALGTIAYHMLGGRPPFTGDITQIIMQKVMQAAPALSTLRSGISPGVEQAVMHALAKEPDARPASISVWIEELESQAGDVSEREREGDSRVVILAPAGAEVYIDDERYGSVGRSGRIILTAIAPGRHVLRVSRSGDADDERVIEVRSGASEQIIQAQFRSAHSGNQLSPSRGGSLNSGTGGPASTPEVVMCARCGVRYAAGVKFCGRCGNNTFQPVHAEKSVSGNAGGNHEAQPGSGVKCPRCNVSYPAGTKFCGRCGTAISGGALAWSAARPVEVICKFCRASYPAGTKFCGRCGNSIKP